MAIGERFGLAHIAALLIGAAGGYAASVYGPPRYSFAPQVAALQQSVDSLVREKAQADSATAHWRNTTDRERTDFTIAMQDTTAKYRGIARRATTASIRRADSLVAAFRLRGDTGAATALGDVVVTIMESDSACTLAVSSCQHSTDSLSAQIADRDSIITYRDTALVRALFTAQRGASLAASTERARQAAVQRSRIAVVLAAVFGALAILK